MNERAGDKSLNLYALIDLLYSEASLISLYTILISEVKLKRRQRKSTVANEYALHAKWKEYEKRDCTTERLLTFASRKCPTSFPE